MFTEGYDYKVETTNVSFPNGSLKDDKQCINITIIDDCLIENKECFRIVANVVADNSSTVRFGGGLRSTSGHIDVIIEDNDGMIIIILANL